MSEILALQSPALVRKACQKVGNFDFLCWKLKRSERKIIGLCFGI